MDFLNKAASAAASAKAAAASAAAEAQAQAEKMREQAMREAAKTAEQARSITDAASKVVQAEASALILDAKSLRSAGDAEVAHSKFAQI